MAVFKKGDQVKLKSGGPVMTVTNSFQGFGGDQECTCEWWSAEKKSFDGKTFVEEALVLHDPTPLGVYKTGGI